MSLKNKIAMAAGKKVVKIVAKKITKKLDAKKIVNDAADSVISKTSAVTEEVKNISPTKIENNSAGDGIISKTTSFLKQAGKEFSTSDVVDIAGMVTGTSAVLGLTTFAGKTALDVKETSDILTEKFEQLRAEGKITQDILDAILCENKSKLEIACDEVFETEKIGKTLEFLSEEKIEDALSLRKAITKTVIHKILG